MYDLETLRAVYAFATVRDIIVADELLTRSEVDFYASVERALRAKGLTEADGTLNPSYYEALGQAERRLGDELPKADKLELIGLFHQTSKADQDLDEREGEVIQRASEVLKLERQEVLDYLMGRYLSS